MQGHYGSQRPGIVDYDFVVPLSARFCLGAANWEEIAEQLGNIVELKIKPKNCSH